ncbi:Transglutaminase domain protein [Desulfosarcina cetonica]|nr:Transglutaminase domain protein [Desulfosarcina cetonica]
MENEFIEALKPTPIIDSDDPHVIAFTHRSAKGAVDDKARAVRLYYAVRDGIRYDPYTVDLTIAGMRASTTLSAGRAWCVPKAVLLAACCRVLGIPARLGYADVRNHLATERLKRLMNTDVFYWHGYTDIFIDGRWVKATPAFNIELCHRFQLKPLEFDGSADSLFHPFDMTGQLHMEYIRYHGTFADAPLDRIKASFEKYYGLLLAEEPVDFEREIVAEQSRQGSGQ